MDDIIVSNSKGKLNVYNSDGSHALEIKTNGVEIPGGKHPLWLATPKLEEPISINRTDPSKPLQLILDQRMANQFGEYPFYFSKPELDGNKVSYILQVEGKEPMFGEAPTLATLYITDTFANAKEAKAAIDSMKSKNPHQAVQIAIADNTPIGKHPQTLIMNDLDGFSYAQLNNHGWKSPWYTESAQTKSTTKEDPNIHATITSTEFHKALSNDDLAPGKYVERFNQKITANAPKGTVLSTIDLLTPPKVSTLGPVSLHKHEEKEKAEIPALVKAPSNGVHTTTASLLAGVGQKPTPQKPAAAHEEEETKPVNGVHTTTASILAGIGKKPTQPTPQKPAAKHEEEKKPAVAKTETPAKAETDDELPLRKQVERNLRSLGYRTDAIDGVIADGSASDKSIEKFLTDRAAKGVKADDFEAIQKLTSKALVEQRNAVKEQIQRPLIELGILPAVIDGKAQDDGLVGKNTRPAIRELLGQQGFSKEQLAALDLSPSALLKNQVLLKALETAKTAHIGAYQEKLSEYSGQELKTTGVLDADTLAAIKNVQSRHGITVDGKMNLPTAIALETQATAKSLTDALRNDNRVDAKEQAELQTHLTQLDALATTAEKQKLALPEQLKAQMKYVGDLVHGFQDQFDGNINATTAGLANKLSQQPKGPTK